MMDRNNATGYFRDVTIKGFDTAMLLSAGRETMVSFEYGTLQANCIAVDVGEARSGGGGDNLTCRKMSITAPKPLVCRRVGQVMILESSLQGSEEYPAVEVEKEAFFYGRKNTFDGCNISVETVEKTCSDNYMEEFYSTEPLRLAKGCRIDIKDIPENEYPADPSQWAVVEDFGAVGDGITDDTEAIRKAFASGKPAVFFAGHIYAVSGSINVPANVNEVAGAYSMIVRCSGGRPDGIFVVSEKASGPLRIRRFSAAGGTFAEQYCERELVLEDIFVEFNHVREGLLCDNKYVPRSADHDSGIWICSRNADSGTRKRQFVTNCIMPVCAAKDGNGMLENVEYYGRMLDSEHVDSGLYAFKNSVVSIFGFKSENSQTLLYAGENTRMEVLGGSMLEFCDKEGPLIVCDASEISAMFLLWQMRAVPNVILVKDGNPLIRGEDIVPLKSEDAAVVVL